MALTWLKFHRPCLLWYIFCGIFLEFETRICRTQVPRIQILSSLCHLLWCLLWLSKNAYNFCSWKHRSVNQWYVTQTYISNSLRLIDVYRHHWTGSPLIKVMAYHLFGTTSSKPMMTYCTLDSYKQTWMKSQLNYKNFHSTKCNLSSILSQPQWVMV